MDCIHDAERETVESELSFPLDRNNPKYSVSQSEGGCVLPFKKPETTELNGRKLIKLENSVIKRSHCCFHFQAREFVELIVRTRGIVLFDGLLLRRRKNHNVRISSLNVLLSARGGPGPQGVFSTAHRIWHIAHYSCCEMLGSLSAEPSALIDKRTRVRLSRPARRDVLLMTALKLLDERNNFTLSFSYRINRSINGIGVHQCAVK